MALTVFFLTDRLELVASHCSMQDIEAVEFATLDLLLARMEHEACHGLVLDLKKTMRAGEGEKRRLQEVLGRMPHVRINVLPDGELRILGDWESFLDCLRSAGPSSIRSCCRVVSNVPVVWRPAPLERMDRKAAWQRTHALDVSGRGMCLYSADPLGCGDYLWLGLPFLDSARCMLARICWKRDWGMEFRLSGMGIEFIRVPMELHDAYCQALDLDAGLDTDRMQTALLEAGNRLADADFPEFPEEFRSSPGILVAGGSQCGYSGLQDNRPTRSSGT